MLWPNWVLVLVLGSLVFLFGAIPAAILSTAASNTYQYCNLSFTIVGTPHYRYSMSFGGRVFC